MMEDKDSEVNQEFNENISINLKDTDTDLSVRHRN